MIWPTDQRGSTMVEASLAFLFIAIVMGFILDAGIALFRYSTLTHATAELSRHLAIDLGQAFRSNKVRGAPWNGNCDAYLRDEATAYISSLPPGDYSATDNTRMYYFGTTFDGLPLPRAINLLDPDAPYALLIIKGRLTSACILCKFIPPAMVLTTTTSVLVEYNSQDCNDY